MGCQVHFSLTFSILQSECIHMVFHGFSIFFIPFVLMVRDLIPYWIYSMAVWFFCLNFVSEFYPKCFGSETGWAPQGSTDSGRTKSQCLCWMGSSCQDHYVFCLRESHHGLHRNTAVLAVAGWKLSRPTVVLTVSLWHFQTNLVRKACGLKLKLIDSL